MWRQSWQSFVIAVFMCIMMLLGGRAYAADAGIVHPEEGVYYLVPKCAQGCALSVQDGNKAEGTNVVIHRNVGENYQQWRLIRIGNGDFYKLEAVDSGYVLNVDNGVSRDGTQVTVWSYGGNMHQYRFLDVGDGYYAIQAHIDGTFVLDVAGGAAYDGTNVHVWTWNGSDAQRWKLVKKRNVKGNGDVNGDGKVTKEDVELLLQYVQGKRSALNRMDNADVNGDGAINTSDVVALTRLVNPPPVPDPKPTVKTLPNGWYKITTGNGLRRVLDVGGARTSVGSNIQLYDDVNVNQQKFYLRNVGNGYFTLKAGHCNLYVAAANASGNNYTNVELAGEANTPSQQWRLIDAGGGLYYIESKLREKLSLDCADRSNANETNIQLWNRGNVSWNKWQFASVSAPVIPKTANIHLGVPYYTQSDARWKNVKINAKNTNSKTIGQVGCLLTAVSMKYSYQTGSATYPNAMKNKLRFTGNDLLWQSVYDLGYTYNQKLGSSINQNMMYTIYQQLKANKPVIIGGTGSAGQHWIVITGYTGQSTASFNSSDFTINDPNHSDYKTLDRFIAGHQTIKGLVY